MYQSNKSATGSELGKYIHDHFHLSDLFEVAFALIQRDLKQSIEKNQYKGFIIDGVRRDQDAKRVVPYSYVERY